MKNKNKFGKAMVLIVLTVSLVMPMVLASDIQEFLEDMEANPENYYILHNRTLHWMNDTINNFANHFGVSTSNTIIPNKNFIIISIMGENFANANDYITHMGFTYVETNQLEEINYTLISLAIEKDYKGRLLGLSQPEIDELWDRLDLNGDRDVTAYEILYDNLNVALDYLLSYDTTPIEKELIKVIKGEIVEDMRPPTCEEFSDYDYTIWYKDEYLHQGEVADDFCSTTNILGELTCMDNGYVNYEFWTCRRGCSDGRCIYTPFSLIQQYSLGDISYRNFRSAINTWLNIDI